MVARHEIVERLRSVRLFSNLSLSALEDLAKRVRSVEYTRGTLVYRQGEPGDRYFIVHRGSLRATRIDPEGEAVEVRRLGPGEGVGETSLLLGDVRDVTLEAVERSVLLYIERADFEQFLEEHPRAERALVMRPDVAERRRYPRFPWMEEDEFPIKVLHRHPVMLVLRLIPFLFILTPSAAGIGVSISWILSLADYGGWLIPVLSLLLLLAATIGAAGAVVFGLSRYVDWRNDLYIVTNRRVAHRERTGLLGLGKENLSAAPIDAVQDVNVTRIGALASLFNFGDLTIETAGGGGRVEFFTIPHPEVVQQAILQQQARARALARIQQREQIRQVMYRYFGKEPGKPSQEQPSAPPEERRARSRLRGCLLLPLSVLRYFFPPLWERNGEQITWRKHWVELFRTAGLALTMLVISLSALVSLLATQPASPSQPSAAQPFRVRLSLLGFLFLSTFVTLLWFLWKFEDWRNDYYQVTANRIIHVERKPFYIRHERREASLDAVTNVRAERTFWGRVLRYGDVVVETRTPEGVFHFRAVARPEAVQQEIFAHVAAFNRRRQQQEAQRRRAEMVDWFIAYDEFRRPRPESSQEGE